MCTQVHCTGYGKNRDLAVPFWSTKDAGQKPFSFQIGMGGVIKVCTDATAMMPQCVCRRRLSDS